MDQAFNIDELSNKIEQMDAVLLMTNSSDAMALLDDQQVGPLLGLLSTLTGEAKALMQAAKR